MNVIYISIDRVYGNIVAKPVCERAKLLAKLAGTKTLTSDALGTIRALGYTVMPVAGLHIGGPATTALDKVLS